MKKEDLSTDELNAFKITFSAEEVEQEDDKTLTKLQSSVKVVGHEKGAAPLDLLRKLFNSQLQSTTGDALLAKAMGALSADFPLNIKPEVHPDYRANGARKYTGLKLSDGSREILVQWPNPKQVPITNLVCEIEVEKIQREGVIESQLEILKIQASALNPVSRPSIETDYIVCRVEVMSKGTSFGVFPNQSINVRLKESMFGEKLGEAALGKTKGEMFVVKKYFSPNFHYAPLRDLESELHVEITDVFESVVPELNDEFAVKVGAADMEDLRAKIGAKWDLAAKKKQEAIVSSKILDVLLANNPFEVDESLLKKNLKYAQEDILGHMGFQGTYEELMEKLPEQSDKDKIAQKCQKTAESNTRWNQLMLAVISSYPKETTVTREDLLRYAFNPESGNSAENELKAMEGRNDYNLWVRNKRFTKAYEFVKTLATIKEIDAPKEVLNEV